MVTEIEFSSSEPEPCGGGEVLDQPVLMLATAWYVRVRAMHISSFFPFEPTKLNTLISALACTEKTNCCV